MFTTMAVDKLEPTFWLLNDPITFFRHGPSGLLQFHAWLAGLNSSFQKNTQLCTDKMLSQVKLLHES